MSELDSMMLDYDDVIEIDFVMRYKGECTLVEVKATTGNTKSTRTILNHPEKYHVTSAIKLGDYNVGKENQILTLIQLPRGGHNRW